MKCKQVDDLLFSYCDLQEMPPRIRQELEQHLRECPECRKQADFTAREREALVYDEDVPELSPDFTKRVLASVTEGQTTVTPSTKTLISSQIGSRGWWAMGMVAAVVVALLVLPGSFMNPVQPTGQQIADAENQNTRMMAEKSKEPGEKTLDQAKIALEFGYTNRESDRVDIGRGTQSASVTSAGGNGTANVAVFHPSYLPPDYHLIRVESDVEDNISIYYGDDKGGYICLKTLPGVEQDMKTAAVRSEGSSVELDEPTKQAVSESDPTVIRWTSEYQGTLYRFELTGSLSPEELARVAASVK
jgi:hypothetical protein